MLRPLPFIWSDGAMHPDARFRQLAQRQFKEGERYVLNATDEVSHKERGRYHAMVNEAWQNLSEEALVRYPTDDHLRKWALVKAGWRKENYAIVPTENMAIKHAAFMRGLDNFAVVTVGRPAETDYEPGQPRLDGDYVIRTYVPRTQKVGNPDQGLMTLEEWRRSAQQVLDILSGTIGVSRKALEKEGRLSSP